MSEPPQEGHITYPKVLLKVYDDPVDAVLAWIFRDRRMTDRNALANILIKRRRQLRERSLKRS